jgi:hypothetical protein
MLYLNWPWQILNGFRWVSSRVFQNLTIMHKRWILHKPYLGKLITGGFCWDIQNIINMSWKFPKKPSMWYIMCYWDFHFANYPCPRIFEKSDIQPTLISPQQLTKKYSQKTPNLEMVSLSTTTELNMIIA